MKLIIDIPDDDDYKAICSDQGYSHAHLMWWIIRNGTPYDKVIDEVTELLENEWGYEGMRDDVSRIMKGGAE